MSNTEHWEIVKVSHTMRCPDCERVAHAAITDCRAFGSVQATRTEGDHSATVKRSR